MARAYSLELRERVLEAVAAGLPLAEAARRFRVSVASIVRWRALARRQGSARPRADIIPSPSVPRSLCRLPYGGQARESQTDLGK